MTSANAVNHAAMNNNARPAYNNNVNTANKAPANNANANTRPAYNNNVNTAYKAPANNANAHYITANLTASQGLRAGSSGWRATATKTAAAGSTNTARLYTPETARGNCRGPFFSSVDSERRNGFRYLTAGPSSTRVHVCEDFSKSPVPLLNESRSLKSVYSEPNSCSKNA